MQPHGEQHNGSSKRINLAHWPWWYLLANGRQWRTPWADPMSGAWQPPTHSVIQQQVHCYDLSRYSQYYIARIYLVTANTTCDDLSRYSQYYIARLYLATANTTLLWSISSQPILHCYDLSRHSQYYIAIIYLVTANTTLLWSISLQPILICYNLSRYSQQHIPMIYLVTANTTLL